MVWYGRVAKLQFSNLAEYCQFLRAFCVMCPLKGRKKSLEGRTLAMPGLVVKTDGS
jgi:hypothetical protein